MGSTQICDDAASAGFPHPTEVVGQVRSILPPTFWVLREALANDAFQCGGRDRLQRRYGRRLGVHDVAD
jgi:hypothetical protein